MKERVLSGIRATGRLHLGNYLGAVKGMLELSAQPDIEAFYMVADVHGITTPFDVEELRYNRREVIIDYLAAGLNPDKSVLFLQSEVPEHLELAFYFSSVMSIARMQHLPTFKEKVKQYPQHATMALLNYPILMASDILVYKAGLVPVGIDQEPHIEIAREIARKMNDQYGMDFPEPQRFSTPGGKVPSLTGEGKMSKTVEGSYINLTDDLETIKARVAKIPTDGGRGGIQQQATSDKSQAKTREKKMYIVNGEPSHGVAALMEMVEFFIGADRRSVFEQQYQSSGVRYGEVKSELAEAIYKELEPIQERRRELEADPAKVDQIIREGNDKARAVARETVVEIREKMGLK